MAQSLRSVKGMPDLLPPESAKWHYFEHRCRELFTRFGYEEIRTPILEPTALFQRGIGEATDVVEKEMYSFTTGKDNSVTMRPEMTASCVRAYIQHSVHRQEPVTRWFYSGPMFRHERMQAGRYRQFYQIGVEAFGIAEPTIEAEQIAMLCELYESVGISDLTVLINSVGDGLDRARYRQALLAYATPLAPRLCGDCQRRMETNPLRLLDCKVPSCKEELANAPSILDSLGQDTKAHFEGAQQALKRLGVLFRVDPRLVRGLDYYTGTVFEIIAATDVLGAQSTIVAGGRYDGLVESLGGPKIPAVGFALGVERAMLSINTPPEHYRSQPVAFIASHGKEALEEKLSLAFELRRCGLLVEIDHRDVSMKSQFKRADKVGALYVITIGDDELANSCVQLKDMTARTQEVVPRDEIMQRLSNKLATQQ